MKSKILAKGKNTVFLSVAICLAVLRLAHSEPVRRLDIDHLVPVNGLLLEPYQRLLAKSLLLKSNYYVRVTVLPSAEGEAALSVYQTNKGDAVLTCAKAKKNLWAAAFEIDTDLRRDPHVDVNRRSTPFPKTAALRLCAIVREASIDSRPRPRSDRGVMEGTNLLFSVAGPLGEAQGLLTPEAEGPVSKSFRRITQLLIDYSDSTPGKRPTVIRDMNSELEKIARNSHKGVASE